MGAPMGNRNAAGKRTGRSKYASKKQAKVAKNKKNFMARMTAMGRPNIGVGHQSKKQQKRFSWSNHLSR